jgi:excisionase family DNA binding protein
METRDHHSMLELLQSERYTPQDLAEILGVSAESVCHAAFSGELRAHVVGHDIVDIRREDVLAWLKAHGPDRPKQ